MMFLYYIEVQMLVNSSLTVYHKVVKNREDTWEKHFYKNIWWFGGKGSSLNKGYAVIEFVNSVTVTDDEVDTLVVERT